MQTSITFIINADCKVLYHFCKQRPTSFVNLLVELNDHTTLEHLGLPTNQVYDFEITISNTKIQGDVSFKEAIVPYINQELHIFVKPISFKPITTPILPSPKYVCKIINDQIKTSANKSLYRKNFSFQIHFINQGIYPLSKDLEIRSIKNEKCPIEIKTNKIGVNVRMGFQNFVVCQARVKKGMKLLNNTIYKCECGIFDPSNNKKVSVNQMVLYIEYNEQLQENNKNDFINTTNYI